jgi:hypothetical protein
MSKTVIAKPQEVDFIKGVKRLRTPGNLITLVKSNTEYVVGSGGEWHLKEPKIKISKKDRIRLRRSNGRST